MADITRNDIFDGLMKMQRIGKRLPYMDRIKTAEDKDKSLAALLDELVQTWWDLLAPMHIGQERFEKAINRACLINTPNSQIINPGMVVDVLKDIEREDVAQQVSKATAEKKDGFNAWTDEARTDGQATIKWTYATMARRQIMPYARPVQQVIADVCRLYGITREQAERQINIIRCWHNDRVYAMQHKVRCKTSLAIGANGRLVLRYV